MRLSSLIACIAAGFFGLRCEAAIVDVDFAAVEKTSVGTMLKQCLLVDPPATALGAEPATTLPDLNWNDLHRVLVSWEGTKSAPMMRFQGMTAQPLIDRLRQIEVSMQTPLGEAWSLPHLQGFSAICVDASEILVATPATLGTLALQPWPVLSGHALDFKAPGSDLKLGDLQDKISDFHLTYEATGDTLLVVNTPNEKSAKAVDRYIWWRKPVVFAGADVGIKKLKFPARLLDETEIKRKSNVLSVTVSLKDDMRDQAFTYLSDAIARELRRYQPH